MPMTKPTSEQVTFLAAGSGATQRTALDKLRDVVSVKDFGAVGDGVADDTAAIQAAVTYASSNNIRLMLGVSHLVSSSITVTGNVDIASAYRATTITTTSAIDVFSSTASNIRLNGIFVSGAKSLLYQSSNCNDIEIIHCRFTGVANTANLYLFYTDSQLLTANVVRIKNCYASDCTPVFADGLAAELVEVANCVFENTTQFVVRILDQLSTGRTKTFRLVNNYASNINGNMVSKAATARMFAVEADDVVYVENNILDGAESTTAANFIYFKNGSLVCTGNVVRNVKTINSISVIDDKCVVTTNDYFLLIADNEFDQYAIAEADHPEAIIRVNESRNVSVVNNTFRGVKAFATRFYHSVDTGNYPENVTFVNNSIHDHAFPVVVQVFQNIKRTFISSNAVHKITNPNSTSVSARTECRIVDVYQTFSNGFNLDGVSICNNVLVETSGVAFIATIYRNVSATTSNIKNVYVTGNDLIGIGITVAGSGIVRFTTATMDPVTIANNSGQNGLTNTIGATPADCRVFENRTSAAIVADQGNTDATLTFGSSAPTVIWASPLTNNRTATLSSTNVHPGAGFRIVRAASSTGAFVLNVGTAPLKALSAGEWADVEYNGTAWVLTGFGAL